MLDQIVNKIRPIFNNKGFMQYLSNFFMRAGLIAFSFVPIIIGAYGKDYEGLSNFLISSQGLKSITCFMLFLFYIYVGMLTSTRS